MEFSGSIRPRYNRTTLDYRYDEQTGNVYAPNGHAFEHISNNVLFYIESVEDDKMVVRNQYIMWPEFEPNEELGYNVYRREILKAVTSEKDRNEWFEKYVLI
ncbi:MAG: hypothetical protein NC217_07620 [Muribaculaceae bacterium]|nr:hypothetical protein [Muribaculaceae bacterium]